MKKELNIYSELNDISDALKQTFSISSISESNGVSTITTESIRIFDNLSITQNLTDGMIVTMDNINYSVSNVSHTPNADTFQVTGTGLTATEWNVAFNFQTGSRFEILQILNQDSGSLDRFPLIWLLPPSDLNFDNQVYDFETEITLVFAHKANKTDRTTTRITSNFEPILQPLVSLYFKWLQSSNFAYMLEFFGYEKPINYNKTDFPFYGTSDKKKEVLNTTTDAVELSMDLTFKKQFIN